MASENSAPIGPIHTVEAVGHLDNDVIIQKVNGDLRQGGDLNQSIGKTPEMILYLSEYIELVAGDVIVIGTPAGVGPGVKDDIMEIAIMAWAVCVFRLSNRS